MSSGIPAQPSGSEDVFEAEFADDQRPPRQRMPWSGWLIILFFVALLLAPLLFNWLPAEIARWHQAAAIEQRLEGDLEGAISSLRKTIEEFPEQDGLKRQLVDWLIAKGDYEQALEETNRLLEQEPNSPRLLLKRSVCYQHLGRFKEGVADNLALLELSDKIPSLDRGSVLNGLAYSRALANEDLELALEESQKSIVLAGEVLEFLDTRGFIQYLLGDLDAAQSDLDTAVDLVEARHNALTRRFRGEDVGVVDRREFKIQMNDHAKGVAVLRYHRSLVLESLGETERAEEDRQRVVELGFEPGPDLF